MKRFEFQVVARCKPEHVWQVFADMENWPRWNPVVGKSHWISGDPWNLGSKFFMLILHPQKIKFKPVINEISAPNRVAWTGSSIGFKGTHWHEFTAQADGNTLVKTWEHMSGFLTMFIGKNMSAKLVNMYSVWLNSLVAEAEKLASSQSTLAATKVRGDK